MSQKFSKVRCGVFLAVLLGLFFLSTTYKDKLFEMSHGVILDLQAGHGHDSDKVKLLKAFSHYTEDIHYVLLILILSPFLSRERFWYYTIAVQLATFSKLNLKMLQSEPRPVWVWSDLTNLGCSSSFGSPSGHSTRSSNLAFLVILDLFFASEWSQRKYADLNKMQARTHKLAFALVSLFAVTFWLAQLYDRVFLGKHTINQVILGSQLGIWCAFFSHFVLRDSIFAHITKLTGKVQKLTRAKALKYCLYGILCVMLPILITVLVGITMNATKGLKQEWLINLRDTCGENFDVDSNGELIANANGMYMGTIMQYSSVCGFLGLYLGQVMFRYTGAGRLSIESYTAKKGIFHQLFFSAIYVCLW